MSALKPLNTQLPLPQLEERTLEIWRATDAFRRSVRERPASAQFIFYDGPPFATGLPHYGHLVASTIKDIVPRYWTMRGLRVERRFGWDTHGLPIEMEMEKKLGLSGPTSVREYGVDRFNEACRENVLRYTAEWEEVITRLGRWVDFKDDYKTMDLPFMESVWWVFKALWDKGLVYQDFRVMPFPWRLSTSLSNFEANLDYRDVQDPAITVRMPLVGEDASLLIWTTTPWTLPSNLAVAVGPDITYVRAQKAEGDADQDVYYVAEARLKATLGEGARVLARLPGSSLVGRAYVPLFDFFADRALLPAGQGRSFVVIGSSHVTTDSGTGLVHMAPDFGEDDFNACRAHGIALALSVDDEGRFKPVIMRYAGQNIKEADPEIIAHIKKMGRLFKHATLQHSYPYCWRSGTPLIYRAVPARFVRVEALRERMVALNEQIHWVPEQVGSKRFGNWLADARDWNVSRKRFWGTPLPVWRCGKCEAERCVGSVAELEGLTGARVTDLHPHKIDHLVMRCEKCGGEMRRIEDVFDCWFESGAMPYAQSHYPFEDKDGFERRFPAQFIAEGLDQTRGWFYTLLVLSAGLFDRPPFENVVVNGLVLAEDGSKMSKSKQNYPPPQRVLNTYGADALRAYLINSPIVRAEPLRFSEEGVKEVVRSVLIPLRSAWGFFTQYALVDGWSPTDAAPALNERPELDRWALSTLQSLIGEVNEQMEGYYLYKVVPPIVSFIDDLTNWYIRRSRRRFWRSAETPEARRDKAAAYATLYEVLVTFAKVMAPVLPFITEAMYQHLVVDAGAAAPGEESVHLCAYPQVDAAKVDRALEAEVALVRQVVRMGRALRTQHSLKTRTPLAGMTVVTADGAAREALRRQEGLLLDELNIKALALSEDDGGLSTLTFKANFKTLGRRMGARMKAAAAAIEGFGPLEWGALRGGHAVLVEGEALTPEDVLVTHHPRAGVVLEVEGGLTVALDTALTPELTREGMARDLISLAQKLRKGRGLAITDRVRLTLTTPAEELRAAVEALRAEICAELLADSLTVVSGDPAAAAAAAPAATPAPAAPQDDGDGDGEEVSAAPAVWVVEGHPCFMDLRRS